MFMMWLSMGVGVNSIGRKLLVLIFASCSTATLKTWRYDYDIRNPKNWVGGKAQENCDGLVIEANTVGFQVVVDNLNVKKIELPQYGSLSLMDNANINFDEHSEDLMNCVHINEPFEVHYWMKPESWIIEGDENNVAIPHRERVPCDYDDVHFPAGWKSGLCHLLGGVKVKSFRFGNEYLDQEGLSHVYYSYPFVEIFIYYPFIETTGKSCQDKTGCRCGNLLASKDVCWYVTDTTSWDCLDPIMPIGFCTKICGASILFEPMDNFDIDKMRKSVKGYSSDTYVSKVTNGSSDVIQIIFAEKQFSGRSLDEAKELHSLLSDINMGATNIELLTSGPYFVEGATSRNAVSIVFGTLCGVIIVFAFLFFIYSPRGTIANLRNRYHFTSRPLSSFKTNLFAKYDNAEEAGLIIGEAQSLAGSVVSLDKSFDNPMYGKPSTSEASTSYGAVGESETKVTKSEISLENPLYDIEETVQELSDTDDDQSKEESEIELVKQK